MHKHRGTPCSRTHLLAGGRTSAHGGGVADVLVVATTVGVLHGVHCNTANLGPLVAFGLVLVVRHTSLQDGLVHAATAGHNANHATAAAV